MASLDHRRPSHDIVQDDIVGSLPYFTADRLLVTRVHRITAAHSHRSQIVSCTLESRHQLRSEAMSTISNECAPCPRTKAHTAIDIIRLSGSAI
jgi:hypothetical protein